MLMSNHLPKVSFSSKQSLDVEIMTFMEAYDKLTQSGIHNPFTPHKIKFYLILLITKNNYTHYVDFKKYELKKGSLLFVAKNQVHHFTDELKNAEGFFLIINSNFLEQNYFLSKSIHLNRLYNYHLESPAIHIEEMGEDDFTDSVKKLYAEYNFPNQFAKEELLRAYINIILLKAERVKSNQATNTIKTYWLEKFNEFKNLLEDNYTNTRSARFYASELLVSYKFLNDIVKKVTDKTAKEFIDDYVTIEIKRYLATTSLSLKEISYKTGFEEPANMTKFFKKNTQKTPLHFRKEL